MHFKEILLNDLFTSKNLDASNIKHLQRKQ